MPSRTVKKQTQFRTYHPRTARASINMQNKANFQRCRMNVTFYEHKDYRNLRLPGQRKNKPNLESHRAGNQHQAEQSEVPARRDLSKNFQKFLIFCPPKPLIPPRLPHNLDLFMQNKPNFPNAKINLTSYGNKDYANIRPRRPRQNKPNLQPK